jgi:hypothetical protein
MCPVDTFDVTPEQAARGRVVPDRDLPMLAAEWLTKGWDGPKLRELAGLTTRDVNEASELLPQVLAELGHPVSTVDNPWDDLPWRGYWDHIWWLVNEMDRSHSPYASAQRVLEVASDVPDLWEPARGDALMQLLRDWDGRAQDRAAIGDQIRAHLRSLSEDQVPPLD